MPRQCRLLLLLITAVSLSGTASAAPARKLLIFSETTGFRHASIEAGISAFRAMGQRLGMQVQASEDSAVFTPAGLADVAAIVLLSNTTKRNDAATDYFTPAQRAAFEAYVHRGGGVVGIHAATDSHYHWPWYGRMIGARFERHPQGTPTGVIRIVDPRHPANATLPPSQRRTDEYYYFADYNPEMHLLATLDPASIGEADVNPNPISWAHEFEGGRIFYTAMGHTPESFSEPFFLRHVENGLKWAMRKR
jgi:type 1 glutamine amidotransferase